MYLNPSNISKNHGTLGSSKRACAGQSLQNSSSSSHFYYRFLLLAFSRAPMPPIAWLGASSSYHRNSRGSSFCMNDYWILGLASWFYQAKWDFWVRHTQCSYMPAVESSRYVVLLRVFDFPITFSQCNLSPILSFCAIYHSSIWGQFHQ